MKAAAYIRVSTEDQSIKGVSLAAQRQKIEQYAQLYCYELSDFVEDAGLSAKNLNRLGIQKVLAMVKKKEIEAVIVSKLDRMTRSVKDLAGIIELFNKYNVALISISENLDSTTASGRMVLNMLGTISQWEREVIGERTSAALQYKKMTGQVYNREPLFGYKNKDGRLVPVSNEQEIISKILRLKAGGKGFSGIARFLNRRRYPTRSGKLWFPQQVKRVIKNAEFHKKLKNGFETSVSA